MCVFAVFNHSIVSLVFGVLIHSFLINHFPLQGITLVRVFSSYSVNVESLISRDDIIDSVILCLLLSLRGRDGGERLSRCHGLLVVLDWSRCCTRQLLG